MITGADMKTKNRCIRNTCFLHLYDVVVFIKAIMPALQRMSTAAYFIQKNTNLCTYGFILVVMDIMRTI